MKKRQLQMYRSILLIVLVVMMTAMSTAISSMLKTVWSIDIILWYAAVVIVFSSIIWTILKRIEKIDENIEAHQKDINKQLVEDTVRETLEQCRIEGNKPK